MSSLLSSVISLFLIINLIVSFSCVHSYYWHWLTIDNSPIKSLWCCIWKHCWILLVIVNPWWQWCQAWILISTSTIFPLRFKVIVLVSSFISLKIIIALTWLLLLLLPAFLSPVLLYFVSISVYLLHWLHSVPSFVSYCRILLVAFGTTLKTSWLLPLSVPPATSATFVLLFYSALDSAVTVPPDRSCLPSALYCNDTIRLNFLRSPFGLSACNVDSIHKIAWWNLLAPCWGLIFSVR